MEKSQKRQIAYKVKINDILKGEYIKEEGEWVPNYVQVGDKKVSRVNLMAVVVSKQDQENPSNKSLLIDDGSGKISIRSFEENGNWDSINVGEFVLVIGRPREYFNEKYIVSEILKKVDDPLWAEIRKLEFEDKNEPKEVSEPETIEVKEEPIVEDINKKIFDLIKNIDSGEGADTQEVITKSKIDKAEGIITSLLEQGEVFEIKPGKLKILE
jgi:RPA family protein